jgi:hypothetical protein
MREFSDIKRKNGGKIQKDLESSKGPEPTFENLQTLVEPIEAETGRTSDS